LAGFARDPRCRKEASARGSLMDTRKPDGHLNPGSPADPDERVERNSPTCFFTLVSVLTRPGLPPRTAPGQADALSAEDDSGLDQLYADQVRTGGIVLSPAPSGLRGGAGLDCPFRFFRVSSGFPRADAYFAALIRANPALR